MQSLGLQGPDSKEHSNRHTNRRAGDDGHYRSAGQEEPGIEERIASDIDTRKSQAADDTTGNENTAGKKAQKSSMYNPRLFYFGTALFLCGSIMTFVAFGFAAQSLLASLEGVQFVSNVIFAKIMRGTYISYQTMAGSIIIVLGVCTVVFMGSHESETLTTREIEKLYEEPGYITYLWFLGSAAAGLRYIEKAYSKRLAQGRPWSMSRTIIPVSYAGFSAIFGTQMVTHAKCLMMVLKLTINGENQFNRGFTYVMLIIFLGCAWVWLYRMGRALKRFDPMFIIPVLQVCFILFAIVTGGIFFKEFHTFGMAQSIFFVFGVLLVCLGLYLLAPSGVDEPSSPYGEENINKSLGEPLSNQEHGDSDNSSKSIEKEGNDSSIPYKGGDGSTIIPAQSFSIRGAYVTRPVREVGQSVYETVGTFASVVADDVKDALTETAAAPAKAASLVVAGARRAGGVDLSGPAAIIDEMEQSLNNIDWRATTAQLNLIAAAQDEGIDYGIIADEPNLNPLHTANCRHRPYIPASLPESPKKADFGARDSRRRELSMRPRTNSQEKTSDDDE